MQQTVVTCVPEVITENDKQSGSSLREFDDEFEITRLHEPTVTGKRGLSRRWQDRVNLDVELQHEDVASLVPACTGARVLP